MFEKRLYIHSHKQTNLYQITGKQNTVVRKCRYGVTCSMRNCRFDHPQPVENKNTEWSISEIKNDSRVNGKRICKYGNSCNRKDCKFVHSAMDNGWGSGCPEGNSGLESIGKINQREDYIKWFYNYNSNNIINGNNRDINNTTINYSKDNINYNDNGMVTTSNYMNDNQYSNYNNNTNYNDNTNNVDHNTYINYNQSQKNDYGRSF